MKLFGGSTSAGAFVGTVALLFAASVQAQPQQVSAAPSTFIVQMKAAPVAEFEGTRPEAGEKIDVASPAVSSYIAQLRASHDEAAAAVGATKSYDYAITVNGFSAKLTAGQVAALRARPDVAAVHPQKNYRLDTNNTSEFLGLNQRGGPWRRKITGENVVIAVLDGGIWPEHPCFEDKPTNIRGDRGRKIPYGPAPKGFTGGGENSCQFGNTEFNPQDAPFECNNKLLTARYYVDGFIDPTAENQGLGVGECLSARDCGQFGDHGTNVAGTAACNGNTPAQQNGEDAGFIAGTAPRARIAHYKVCWSTATSPTGTCSNVDLVAAVEQAIADGVDVMNLSLGSDSPVLGDAFDLALLNATRAGIYVATSAGNNGSGPATVGSPATAPWVTAVGAMQDPGVEITAVEVKAPASIAGTLEAVEGAGPVTLGDSGDVAADVAVAEPANGCGATPEGAPVGLTNDVTGKIALVIRGGCSFNEKYLNAQTSGATAIVVYNDGTTPFRIDPFTMGGLSAAITIPGVMIGFNDGSLIQSTIAGGETASALLSPSFILKRGDRMASFSSRGPNGFTPNLYKPDIIAPGVQILSAGSPLGGIWTADDLYSSINGTSFSSPHVAGLFALIKQVRGWWSPSAVRSAYMTTARQDIIETFGEEPADGFDVGAGMVVPKAAINPGLVFELQDNDLAAYACGQGIFTGEFDCAGLQAAGVSFDPADMNYPAIAIDQLFISRKVLRLAKAVPDYRPGEGEKKIRTYRYRPVIEAPEGFEVKVTPSVLEVSDFGGEEFAVEIRATDATPGEWRFGSITWKRPGRSVRIPLAVNARAFNVPASQSQTGTEGDGSIDLTFGYTGDYAPQVHGINPPTLTGWTLPDDTGNSFGFFGEGTEIVFFDSLPGGTAYASWSTADAYTTGNDNFDMYLYFCTEFSCGLVDSSTDPSSNDTVSVTFPNTDTNILDGTGYLVWIHAFDTEGGVPQSAIVFEQRFGVDNVVGNLSITDAPASATAGGSGTINYSWSGLVSGPGERRVGAISYSTADGVIRDLTLININNDEGGSACDFPLTTCP